MTAQCYVLPVSRYDAQGLLDLSPRYVGLHMPVAHAIGGSVPAAIGTALADGRGERR